MRELYVKWSQGCMLNWARATSRSEGAGREESEVGMWEMDSGATIWSSLIHVQVGRPFRGCFIFSRTFFHVVAPAVALAPSRKHCF